MSAVKRRIYKFTISLGVCIFLAVITWFVFEQTLRHEFVNYDDGAYVYQNPTIQRGLSLDGIARAFTQIHSQNWHPLTTISHMVDSHFFGLRAGGHHFTNVLLHSIAAVLLFLVLKEITGTVWRSAFVAAVFAIHPLRVESVAWVAERKDVLSGVFFMLTLGAYVRYARAPRLGRYIIVSILFALGLMSKPMLVTVPLVLLLLDYWPLKRIVDLRTLLRFAFEKIPLFALSAASCVATFLAQQQALGSAEELPLAWRISNGLVTHVTYIWQMLWPAKLAVFYPHPENSLALWQIIAAGGFLVGFSAIAFAIRKRHPYVLTGWFWYVIMLLPVIGFFQVGLQGHADRYSYLPQIGLYLLVTWAVADLASSWSYGRVVLSSGAIGVLVALSVRAWGQTRVWKNSEALWRHALTVTSNNDMAHAGLGGILLGDRKVDEAISQFEEALKIRPNNAEAHTSVAAALIQKGNVSDAIAHWQKGVELQPEDVTARDALAIALIKQGRPSEAIAQWQESLKHDPDNPKAQNNLAWVLAASPDASLRDGPKAVQLAERASALSGFGNALILRTLAAAYAETGRFSDAIEAAKRGLEVAREQKNSALSDELQRNIALYETNSPMRDTSLTGSGPSS